MQSPLIGIWGWLTLGPTAIILTHSLGLIIVEPWLCSCEWSVFEVDWHWDLVWLSHIQFHLQWQHEYLKPLIRPQCQYEHLRPHRDNFKTWVLSISSQSPKYLILAKISDLWFKPPICHLSPHFSKILYRIVQLFLYQPAGVCSGPLGISYFTIRDLSLNISSPDLSSCLRSRHLVMSSSVLSSRLQTSSSPRVSQYVSETSILANSQIFGLNPQYVT